MSKKNIDEDDELSEETETSENESNDESSDEKEEIEEESENNEEEIEEENIDEKEINFQDDEDNEEENIIEYNLNDFKVIKKKKRLQFEKKYIKATKKKEDRNNNKFPTLTLKYKIDDKKFPLRKTFINKLSKFFPKIAEQIEQLIFESVKTEFLCLIVNLTFGEFWINSFYNTYGLILKCISNGKIVKDKLKDVFEDLTKKRLNFNFSLFNNSKEKYLLNYKLNTSELEIEDGIDTCNKCGKSKTLRVQLQTRGGDEPMTNFIRCVNCGNRWRY